MDATEHGTIGEFGAHGWSTVRPVGELRPGDHAWLASHHPEEKERVVGDFVFDGLNTAQRVVCLTDVEPHRLPGMYARHHIDVRPFTEADHLRVIPWRLACGRQGRADPEQLGRTLERELDRAFSERFRAARILADMTWAADVPGGVEFMLACDGAMERLIGPSTRAIALCQVDLRAVRSADALNALRNHHEVLVEVNPEYDDGVLRMTRTYAPHGLRLEGEIDGARHPVLTDALTTVSRPRAEVHLELGNLKFIDLGALKMLGAHAMELTRGNGLVLDNPTPDLEGVIRMVGFHLFPGITRGEGWRSM
ncbi:MEDS domain-containing protein [Actinocorallia sp. API 0066]|uniref:MEDS domain-containing protein n=1 Tax=Actinocorallia sp. API 0066 TaxID=2896846 RepID=UPI001E41D9A8|nr:MEDS domain-containing protein [Actinocorallia sp. API 0066]MCD0451396.1 MEDS domain-containing protein [Actinocorallia sp. API 0066]